MKNGKIDSRKKSRTTKIYLLIILLVLLFAGTFIPFINKIALIQAGLYVMLLIPCVGIVVYLIGKTNISDTFPDEDIFLGLQESSLILEKVKLLIKKKDSFTTCQILLNFGEELLGASYTIYIEKKQFSPGYHVLQDKDVPSPFRSQDINILFNTVLRSQEDIEFSYREFSNYSERKEIAVLLQNLSVDQAVFIPVRHQTEIFGIVLLLWGKKRDIQKSCLDNFLFLSDLAAQGLFLLQLQKKVQDDSLREIQSETDFSPADFTDPLTGLPNKNVLIQKMHEVLTRTSQNIEYWIAILLISFDHFNQINETYGELFGDKVITNWVNRIKTLLGDKDTFFRTGGDEFAIIMDNINKTEYPEILAKKIQKSCSEPFVNSDSDIFISVSIGISLNASDNIDPEILFNNASIVLYKVKSENPGQYAVYNEIHSKRLL